nr:ribonuclease H-like domain-containing protein [Tanacetum cinerariifolium]
MKKSYCLVITNDFSRFSWVFFLATKDETSGILKTFISGIENQLDCKVKVIRDYLGKFDEKADEGFFVGYSVVSKAMRVFNKRTRIGEETLNIRFLENAPNVKGNGPDWLFDIDSLTISMNYMPVVAGFQTNDARKKATGVYESQVSDNGGQDDQVTRSEFEGLLQQERQTEHINSTNSFNTVSLPVNTAGPSIVNDVGTPASTNAFEEHPFE